MAEHGLARAAGRRRGCCASRSVCVATARTWSGGEAVEASREARQAVEAARRRFLVQEAGGVEAGAEPHRLLQVVDAAIAAVAAAGRSRAESCSSPCRSPRAGRASAARCRARSGVGCIGAIVAGSRRARRRSARSFLECLSASPDLRSRSCCDSELDSCSARDFSRRDFAARRSARLRRRGAAGGGADDHDRQRRPDRVAR